MPTWFCSRAWFSHVGPFDEGGQVSVGPCGPPSLGSGEALSSPGCESPSPTHWWVLCSLWRSRDLENIFCEGLSSTSPAGWAERPRERLEPWHQGICTWRLRVPRASVPDSHRPSSGPRLPHPCLKAVFGKVREVDSVSYAASGITAREGQVPLGILSKLGWALPLNPLLPMGPHLGSSGHTGLWCVPQKWGAGL